MLCVSKPEASRNGMLVTQAHLWLANTELKPNTLPGLDLSGTTQDFHADRSGDYPLNSRQPSTHLQRHRHDVRLGRPRHQPPRYAVLAAARLVDVPRASQNHQPVALEQRRQAVLRAGEGD